MPTPPSAEIADAPHPPASIPAPTTRGYAGSCEELYKYKLPQDLATANLITNCPDLISSEKQECLVEMVDVFWEDAEWLEDTAYTNYNAVETLRSPQTPLTVKKGSLTPEMSEPSNSSACKLSNYFTTAEPPEPPVAKIPYYDNIAAVMPAPSYITLPQLSKVAAVDSSVHQTPRTQTAKGETSESEHYPSQDIRKYFQKNTETTQKNRVSQPDVSDGLHGMVPANVVETAWLLPDVSVVVSDSEAVSVSEAGTVSVNLQTATVHRYARPKATHRVEDRVNCCCLYPESGDGVCEYVRGLMYKDAVYNTENEDNLARTSTEADAYQETEEDLMDVDVHTLQENKDDLMHCEPAYTLQKEVEPRETVGLFVELAQVPEHQETTVPVHQETTRGTVETFITNVCNYKRGGWCTTCQKFGDKVLEAKKTWERKSNGLFGYKLRKRVTWKCGKPAFKDTTSSSFGRDTSILRTAKLWGADELQVGNFTEGGSSAVYAGVKRLRANSCEPRNKHKKAGL